MIKAALRTHLLGDSAIAALIGTRAYPVKMPQSVKFPAMRLQRVSGNRVHSFDGASGLAQPRIQIDAYDKDYDQVWVLADLIRKRLDGFSGTVGSDVIQGAFLEDDKDFIEDLKGSQIYRVSMDFFVHYTEAVA